VHFSGSVKKLDLWVLAADGQWLDRYYEDESRVSWGPSLYNQPRRTTDEPFASLQLALDQGETESVEFKEWIRAVARDGKTIEILKTAVAFANVHGGDIYIGVDDDAQVCGVKDWLNRDYGSRIQASSSEQQDAYVKDLRRLLNDGTTPSTNATFDWIDAAGLLVLRIRIPGGSEGPYALVENGDLYVRRGATNRKARPAELVALRSSGLRS
jgi:ATP-dependent DNA helicase RecG